MPSITDIIDTVATPPLASLQQVLDTNGPFAPGDHTITQFHTNGAFLLPSGNYSVGGTYGLLVVASTIPGNAGQLIGFNGLVGGQDKDENTYADRIAQVVLYHQLPISGYWAATQRFDIHYSAELNLWPALIGSGGAVGLHVFPGWSVDLFWMCVL